MFKIFCDGGCRNNQSKNNLGAWAFRIYTDVQFIDAKSQCVPNTTNNIMELTAAIEALKAIPAGSWATIYLDSQYVKQGITEWIKRWKRNNWKTTKKTSVANKELWVQLDSLTQARNIKWVWVKGHSGHSGNEEVDTDLNIAMDNYQL